MVLQHPEVSRFVARVNKAIRRGDAESFWACEPYFADMLQTDFVTEAVNEELRNIGQQPEYLGNWRPRRLVMFESSSFALTLSLLETQARYIHTAPALGMCSPATEEGLRYETFRFSAQYRNDVFDPTVELTPEEAGSLHRRELLRINPLRNAYDFRIERPTVIIKFSAAATQNLEWLFNRNTLRAWQANDAELTSTQLRVTAYLLGRLAHQSSLEPLEQLTTHPHHAVRWAAVQNIGRLNRGLALKYLEKAASDPHPHVKRAAEKTLAQIAQKKP